MPFSYSPGSSSALNDAAAQITPNVDNDSLLTGSANRGPANDLIDAVKLSVTKAVDKAISYLGDTITYQIAVTNSGSLAANSVIITDPIPNGTAYVAGSLTVNVPYAGTIDSGIALTNPIAPGQTVSVSFQIKVNNIPNPNPIVNNATASYVSQDDPSQPDGVTIFVESNSVTTVVFRYNFSQQINDLIESVALEQAALAAVINAEGAKIQKMVAMKNITPQELLCLNKSVSSMMDSLSMLEAILKQKISVADCQINGLCR